MAMKNDELMVSMAEDIIAQCNDNSCFTEATDERGNPYFTKVCPFLAKSDDPWTAECLIGDPMTWRIEECRI